MKFKVRNHGHDGSGINCGNFKNEENPFKNRVIDSDKSFKYIEEKNDEIINEIDDNLISNFKMPLSKRLFVYFRYYMFYLFKLNFSSKRFKKAYNKFK